MRNLTTPTDDQMLHFQAWRATALQIMPYMGSLMFSLRPVNSDAVDTFGVDPGHRCYINFDKVIPMGAQFGAEALLHECSHLLAEHSWLAELAGVSNDEHETWNAAADMSINDDLRDAGCDALAKHGVFAAHIGEPDYQTPLHYMEVLRQKQANKPKPQQGQQGGQGQPGQDGQPQAGSGNAPGQGQPTPMKGCGSGAGGRKGGHELGDDETMGGQAEAASAIEKNLVRIATASAVRQHQEQHGIGSVPGGIAQIIDEILTPSKTPWERVLASHVRRAVAHKAGYHDATYKRRNRRRMNETMSDGKGRVLGRVIAPGYIKPIPSIHFYRDTSGSVNDHDLAMATNEVYAIARKLGIKGDDLIVSDIDTMVHQSVKFTGKDSITEIAGRGGTDMGEAIVHALSLPKKPSAIIIATDGETWWPTERPSVPVIVLLINVTSQHWIDSVPEWAHLVEVKDNA
ncbi:VWA containing CoxE family protein [Paeniglutamicibacter antarcticus]|uniref:VWA containing CoxE family protein n=1 Tax=Arthrobacter terrae TaxID=2935737 RepID=A0A931CL09_9MICC|nr:VWA-like domain-containing protein [Arthrobacter terrae]MBG0738902.1 VWA containing CoxE family protein [Arthrobacter terrae]